MSQQEILKILEKLPKNAWITIKEVKKLLKRENSSINSNLKRMRDHGEVETRRKRIKDNHFRNEHRLTDKGRGL